MATVSKLGASLVSYFCNSHAPQYIAALVPQDFAAGAIDLEVCIMLVEMRERDGCWHACGPNICMDQVCFLVHNGTTLMWHRDFELEIPTLSEG